MTDLEKFKKLFDEVNQPYKIGNWRDAGGGCPDDAIVLVINPPPAPEDRDPHVLYCYYCEVIFDAEGKFLYFGYGE